MNITIVALSQKMPDWIQAGMKEFSKRLAPYCRLQIKEIPLINRSLMPLAKIQEIEAEKINKALADTQFQIALDQTGKSLSSEAFANLFDDWRNQYNTISFIIGAPEGLTQNCLQQANFTLSLSQLTFPHTIVRLLLAEQIYRAFMILQKHPYHK